MNPGNGGDVSHPKKLSKNVKTKFHELGKAIDKWCIEYQKILDRRDQGTSNKATDTYDLKKKIDIQSSAGENSSSNATYFTADSSLKGNASSGANLLPSVSSSASDVSSSSTEIDDRIHLIKPRIPITKKCLDRRTKSLKLPVAHSKPTSNILDESAANFEIKFKFKTASELKTFMNIPELQKYQYDLTTESVKVLTPKVPYKKEDRLKILPNDMNIPLNWYLAEKNSNFIYRSQARQKNVEYLKQLRYQRSAIQKNAIAEGLGIKLKEDIPELPRDFKDFRFTSNVGKISQIEKQHYTPKDIVLINCYAKALYSEHLKGKTLKKKSKHIPLHEKFMDKRLQ